MCVDVMILPMVKMARTIIREESAPKSLDEMVYVIDFFDLIRMVCTCFVLYTEIH